MGSADKDKTVRFTNPVRVFYNDRETQDLVPLSIEHSLGGQAGDVCTCKLPWRGLLMDATAVEHPKGKLTLKTTTDEDQEITLFVGWGSGIVHNLENGERGVEFRVSRFHYGTALVGVRELLPPGKSGEKKEAISTSAESSESGTEKDKGPSESKKDGKPREVIIKRDLIFNPVIDGVVRGNMRDVENVGLYMVDYESIRTAQARRFQKYEYSSDEAFRTSADKRIFTLPKAVQYLCELLNRDEQDIDNPTAEHLQSLTKKVATPAIRNVKIPTGLYLNEALDLLLTPVGYTWFLRYNAKNSKPRIYVRRRGDGPKQLALLQKASSPFDPEKNTNDEATLAAGSHTSFNAVTVLSGPRRREVTMELVKGWKREYDSLDEDATATDSEYFQNRPEFRDVFRKFVADEAGDYIGFRDTIKEPADLKRFFGYDAMPKRRKMHPCLTRNADGTPVGPHGVRISWKLESDPSSAEWKPLEEMDYGEVQLLEQEIGIYFSGLLVPLEVWANGGKVKFRVTFSLDEDDRYSQTVKDVTTPLPKTITHVVDAADRFHFREVDKSSEFYDAVKAEKMLADEVDDTEAMKEHARGLLKSYNVMDLGASFKVIGLTTPQLEPGDVITEIRGRDISLSALKGGNGSETDDQFPQITSIRYDLANDCRYLTLQTIRNG